MADITGKVIAVLPTRTGTSAKGTQWSTQTFVLETQEQYPKKIAVDVMNENISRFNVQIGELLTASIDIDAHEYNGRWFNNVKAWNISREAQQPVAPQPVQQAQILQPQGNSPAQSAAPQTQEEAFQPQSNGSDKLPF